ncbi:hypothetical protein BKP35_16245 [Anaerobacillus arseniciselenatis]|uniref:Endospore appendages core domain-containing protein n=1 Tax=Anaerobacillus arseniciselenatis TaxID=85682 RepID=A0A1S2LAN1_9BACI|nr:S-Ena type endospore appendage [Anaerobacillus arseniciselenatis]OIJ09406.1 hypothetical protein BKP35_16245 [Anaerobacillus arseniciselenatis]
MFPISHCFISPCIKVPKVFDWVNRTTIIKLHEEIPLEKKKVKDVLCCVFQIPCGGKERSTLWTSYGIYNIGGSICIEYKKGCGEPLDVFINQLKVTSIPEGSSFTATFSRLESVEIQCNGTDVTGVCCGDFKIAVYIDTKNNCDLHSHRDIQRIDCFLSDCHGNPLSLADPRTVLCKELISPEERAKFDFFTPEGNKTTLHRVEILKQGFVTIEIFNYKNQLCKKCTIPFSDIETFFLCAPSGTKIECEITNVDCKAHIVPSLNKSSPCLKIEIILIICQSVDSVADVKIEFNGKYCQPREEIMKECDF